MSWFEIETHAGIPIRIGQTRLIPFSQTMQVNVPGSGTVAWSRPTAILAQSLDGQEVVLPVRDITRQAQLTLLGLGLLGAFVIWLKYRK